jgi:hypothetical protein
VAYQKACIKYFKFVYEPHMVLPCGDLFRPFGAGRSLAQQKTSFPPHFNNKTTSVAAGGYTTNNLITSLN